MSSEPAIVSLHSRHTGAHSRGKEDSLVLWVLLSEGTKSLLFMKPT